MRHQIFANIYLVGNNTNECVLVFGSVRNESECFDRICVSVFVIMCQFVLTAATQHGREHLHLHICQMLFPEWLIIELCNCGFRTKQSQAGSCAALMSIDK